jgi:hypothetical protein
MPTQKGDRVTTRRRQVEPGDDFATFTQNPLQKKQSQLLIT